MTPDEPRGSSVAPRPSRARAWLLALGCALLGLIHCDPSGLARPTPSASPHATGEGEGHAAAAPSPPPSSPIRIRFDAPLAADGTERSLLGTVRIETDEGELLREVEVRGATLAVVDLPEGAYMVRAHVAGFAREARAIRTPRDELVIALTPIARVAGRVLAPDGSPHGASVRIVGSGIWPAREIEAREDGSFVFEDVPAGVYELEARSGSLVSPPRRGLDVAPESSSFVELRLGEGSFLIGRVVDRRGRGVALAEIVASIGTISPSAQGGVSQPDGSFRVGPFVDERVHLDVRADGFVPSSSSACSTGTPCVITLSEGATLRGRVVDERGATIADAWIEVQGEASDRSPFAASPLASSLDTLLSEARRPARGLEPAASLEAGGLGVTTSVPPIPLGPIEPLEAASEASASLPTAAHATLRTNASGEFVVSGLPPGRFEVIARARGFRAARSARITLVSGQRRDGLVLVLGVGGSVFGTVLDERGRAADARIEARIEDDPIPRYLTTGPRGDFRIDDVGGSVLLYVVGEGHAPLERIVRVEGRDEGPLTIRLGDPRRRLLARVVDARGDPVAGALVRFETLAAGTGAPRVLVADANGELELSPAPDAPLLVEASDPRFVSRPVVVRGDDRVVLTLEEPVTLDTSLLDDRTRLGVADAEVTLRCLGGLACVRTARSDEHGAVRIERLAPGRYALEARASGYAPHEERLDLARPRRGRVIERPAIALTPGLRVEGDVVDRLGRTVEGAEVTIASADDAAALTARTDDRGHFAIAGVPPGRRSIAASHASAGARLETIAIRDDRDPAPLVIRLPDRDDGEARVADRPRREVGIGVELDPARAPTVVTRVSGPSLRAGVLVGDAILAIDGEEVGDAPAARRLMRGALFLPALVELRRGGERLFLRVPRVLEDVGSAQGSASR